MAKVDVFNLKREKVGELDLADDVFGAEVKEHLLYEVVKAQLASRRARHRGRQGALGGQRLDARSSTSRRAPAARARARSARRTRRRRSGARARAARLTLPPAAQGAHRRAQERALAVRSRRVASSWSTASSSPRSRPRRSLGVLDDAAGRQEGARRRRQGEREPAALDPQPAKITSSCRPRASTSTTSSATTTWSSRKDAAKALEARCLDSSEEMPMHDARDHHPPADHPHREVEPAPRDRTRSSSRSLATANKIEIKDAVEKLFNVKVVDVHTMRRARQGCAAWAAATPSCRTGRRRSSRSRRATRSSSSREG